MNGYSSRLPWAWEHLSGPPPGKSLWQTAGIPSCGEDPGICYMNLLVSQPSSLLDTEYPDPLEAKPPPTLGQPLRRTPLSHPLPHQTIDAYCPEACVAQTCPKTWSLGWRLLAPGQTDHLLSWSWSYEKQGQARDRERTNRQWQERG